MHRQQAASEVNGGELPTTGAMTTGYVFRIENQATVSYLQGIGGPGCLVNVRVAPTRQERALSSPRWWNGGSSVLSHRSTTHTDGPDGPRHHPQFRAIGVLLMLMFVRLINVVVIRRRTVKGWKGIEEPGVEGDLLALLNQD